MWLEQTIQRSKKCTGGIIGQTRKLLFYKILAISKSFSDIIQPGAIEDYRHVLYHHLKGSYSSQINISIVRVAEFLEKRGNPFRPAAIAPLHNLSTGEMVPQEVTDRFIGFSSHGKNEYENFRRERFIDKYKNLSDTIHKVNLPIFSSVEPKTKTISQNIRSLTKLEKAQKHYGIARSRGIPIKNILHFDLTMQSCLFTDADLTEKPNKYEIVKELEKNLENSQYTFRKFLKKKLKTSAIMDFMSQVHKIPDEKIKETKKDVRHLRIWSVIHIVNSESEESGYCVR